MNLARVYHSGIHRGEEAIVTGNHRSGMINFSGCHLACNFCYTPEAAAERQGTDYEPEAFETLIESLNQTAENINLISPTLHWAAIEECLSRKKSKPLLLKISGYEGQGLINRMAKLCDVWIPDFKVWDEASASAVNLPKNYGRVTQKALATMMQTHSVLIYDANRKLIRGILIRHLMMPGFFKDSIKVLDALGEINFRGVFNIMTHFLNPKLKRIQTASPFEVAFLKNRALALGMTVLVNGKSEAPYVD